MGRGGFGYISYTALVLLSRVTASSAGLWDVSIDLSPAPPAESGPPFSANASRNRDILPYQVIGILGAYVATVLILGSLLLTVGRRMRKQAQIMAEQPTEMVKPTNKAFDNSPLSPGGSVRGWLRGKKSMANSVRSGKSNLRSPGGASVATFDSNVVEQDRERHREALARVYDAVYAHDESEALPYSQVGGRTADLNAGRPTLRHLDLDRVRSGGSQPISPRSPISPYYAVAPPKDLLAQLSPRYKNDAPQSPVRGTADNRAASYSSDRTTDSSKLCKNIGRLKISAPVQVIRDNEDGARTPLSPKIYGNPGPPPEPPSARTADTYPYTPTTPGTAVSYPFPEDLEEYEEVRQLPQAHPQRTRGYTNGSQPPQSPASPGLPASPAQWKVGSPPRREQTPVGNVSRPLALRQFNEQQKQDALQQSQLNLASPTANQFPMSPTAPWNTKPGQLGGLKSPAIQTTVLSAPGTLRLGPQTAQDRPYSPFFPGVYTTPVTARFTTRAERKQKEKENKAVRGAITEDDQVPDEEDLWRDGYR